MALWKAANFFILNKATVDSNLPFEQEGDPEGWWEETFKSFTDSKPKGPEGISLDITFPSSHHVFGIPERAKQFSLPPTVGMCLCPIFLANKVLA